MNDLELAEMRAGVGNGIECDTGVIELNDAFDLVRESHVSTQECCSDGVCPVTWKPERKTAA